MLPGNRNCLFLTSPRFHMVIVATPHHRLSLEADSDVWRIQAGIEKRCCLNFLLNIYIRSLKELLFLSESHVSSVVFFLMRWHKYGLQERELSLYHLLPICSFGSKHKDPQSLCRETKHNQIISDSIFVFLFAPISVEPQWSKVPSDTFRWLVKISRTPGDLLSNPPISWSKLAVNYFALLIPHSRLLLQSTSAGLQTEWITSYCSQLL